MANQTVKIQNTGSTKFIAHRGLSGFYTENSAAAFKAAAGRNYFGIETDVRLTADGEFVTLHDGTTRRVGDRNLTVSDSTLEQLSKVRLEPVSGAADEASIPRLRDYIEICKRAGKTAVIELKGRFRHRDIRNLCLQLEQLGYIERCIFISFEFENLFLVRLHYPKQPVQYLVKKVNFGLLFRLKLHRMDLDIKYSAVNRELVEKCHSLGILVNCWTVDRPSAAKKLIKMGVDYITTNILEPES